MISFPNAKINIGLNIIGKRPDGFHDLETIFYPLAVKDAVEIIENNNSTLDDIFSLSGTAIDGSANDNICIKAVNLLRKDFSFPSLKIHLHKHIPMGAGLGGGSADGSAVLMMLNKKFELNISTEKLIQYALALGSDCPFFIINKPCFATGRGEVLKEVNIDLSPYKIMIVHPGIHVNTADAFKELTQQNFSPAGGLSEQIQTNITQWKDVIKNNFEEVVFKKHHEIKEIKEKLYKDGAVYSAMSGSGSAVFGIFSKETVTDKIKFPSHYFCQVI